MIDWDELLAKSEERRKIKQPVPNKWMIAFGSTIMTGYPFGRPHIIGVFCSLCEEPLGNLRLDSDEGTSLGPSKIYCENCWKGSELEKEYMEMEKVWEKNKNQRLYWLDSIDLAVQLTRYNMDGPHPWEDEPDFYPDIDKEKFQEWLKQEHSGDCTNNCWSCITCYAEDNLREAEWIINELKPI